MKPAIQKQKLEEYFKFVQTNVNLGLAWTCHWNDLESYPITPTSLVKDDVWRIPDFWCPIVRQKQYRLSIDFNKAVPKHFETGKAEGLKRRLKRLAILDFFETSLGRNGRGGPPTASTWAERCKNLIRAARFSLVTLHPKSCASKCPDGPTLFATLSGAEFDRLKKSIPAWGSGSIFRLNALFSEVGFDDWPSADVAPLNHEKRAGSKAREPFNDVAFTHILRAAIWLNGLQADLLEAYQATKGISLDAHGSNDRASVFAYRRECVQTWSSKLLQPNVPFPFKISATGERRKAVEYASWPLQTVSSLKSLLFLCQTANAILVLASTGMRVGEVMALTFESLEAVDARFYLTGRSFKTTDATSGQQRQWPLPKVAVKALEAQRDLSKALSDGKYLWITFRPEIVKSGTTKLEASLSAFGEKITLPDGRNLAALDGAITAHRFRYSASRYIALSLTGASQVLFDVLGHEDVGVTLGYMLRDRELVEDINKIRREVKAVYSHEVFQHANENGGMAAEMVRKLKTDMLARSGRQELDTDDVAEGAMILGDAELVKPGILCTAQPLERGACSSIPGVRDVGNCTVSCWHHLEMAAHRQTRRKNLDSLLDLIQGAGQGERIFFHGQIIANLKPFPDVIEDFLTDSRLRKALSDCDPRRWSGLQVETRNRLNSIIGTAS